MNLRITVWRQYLYYLIFKDLQKKATAVLWSCAWSLNVTSGLVVFTDVWFEL